MAPDGILLPAVAVPIHSSQIRLFPGRKEEKETLSEWRLPRNTNPQHHGSLTDVMGPGVSSRSCGTWGAPLRQGRASQNHPQTIPNSSFP